MTIIKIGKIELMVDDNDHFVYGLKDSQKCSSDVREFVQQNLMGKCVQVTTIKNSLEDF